jgi:2-polyprenyl-6-hydroxyphenyl methylase/3-demethylubiquinone-9 3-methyltransferase
MRVITESEYCHERLGDRFATALSDYDTRRRVEVLVDDFLAPAARPGATALDVGCGLGFFSQPLHLRGVRVTACDLGPKLVEQTRIRVGCHAVVADALNLVQQFGREQFDMVVSSECIEHTPAPEQAVRQMAGVLKPGGYLALSTPNVLWQGVVQAATLLRLRPFDGFENFSSWSGLRQTLDDCDIEIVCEQGLHLIPFQLRLHRFSRWLDQHVQPLRFCMINICVLGRKRLDRAERHARDIDPGESADDASRVA